MIDGRSRDPGTLASTEKIEKTSGCGLEGPSYGEEKSEETLERGARDEIAMKVNKP